MNNTVTPFSGTSRTISETKVKQENSFLQRIKSRKDKEPIKLEEVVEINKDNYDLFIKKGLPSLKPEILYNNKKLIKTGLIGVNKEEVVSCIDEQSISTSLVSTETTSNLKQKGYKLVHIGCLVIAVKGLFRKGTGTKVLALIYDKRWTDIIKGQIAIMEIDMNNGGGIFYCCPNLFLTLDELKHIQIGIQTKGFEEFSGNNLVLNITFLGKATVQSFSNYKVQIDDLIKILTSE